MALPKLLLGCDPELFLRDKETLRPVSAYGLLQGTKKEPFPVDCGAYQIDGMAVEFNITPAETKAQWHGNITAVLDQIRLKLPDNLELVDIPTAIFDQAYFDAQPEAAREMGCDPDYNAYTGEMNQRPTTTLPMRTAGGHIHAGFTEGRDINDPELREDAFEVVKQMDFYLGLPSLEWDADTKRRSLYGKAGACRVKPYGVEYRPLSCRWVLDEEIRGYVFDASIGAITDLYSQEVARLTWGNSYAMDMLNSGVNYAMKPMYDREYYMNAMYRQPFFKAMGNARTTLDKRFYDKASLQQKFGVAKVMQPKPFIGDWNERG